MSAKGAKGSRGTNPCPLRKYKFFCGGKMHWISWFMISKKLIFSVTLVNNLHSWPPWPRHGFVPSKLDTCMYVPSYILIIAHWIRTLIWRLYNEEHNSVLHLVRWEFSTEIHRQPGYIEVLLYTLSTAMYKYPFSKWL